MIREIEINLVHDMSAKRWVVVYKKQEFLYVNVLNRPYAVTYICVSWREEIAAQMRGMRFNPSLIPLVIVLVTVVVQ